MTGYPKWAVRRLRPPLIHAILRADDTFGPQTMELKACSKGRHRVHGA